MSFFLSYWCLFILFALSSCCWTPKLHILIYPSLFPSLPVSLLKFYYHFFQEYFIVTLFLLLYLSKRIKVIGFSIIVSFSNCFGALDHAYRTPVVPLLSLLVRIQERGLSWFLRYQVLGGEEYPKQETLLTFLFSLHCEQARGGGVGNFLRKFIYFFLIARVGEIARVGGRILVLEAEVPELLERGFFFTDSEDFK